MHVYYNLFIIILYTFISII